MTHICNNCTKNKKCKVLKAANLFIKSFRTFYKQKREICDFQIEICNEYTTTGVIKWI